MTSQIFNKLTSQINSRTLINWRHKLNADLYTWILDSISSHAQSIQARNMIGLGPRPRPRCYSVSLPPPPPISALSTAIAIYSLIQNAKTTIESIWFHMSRSIGQHYIIRRDITTKLYIMHYGYVIQETYMHFFQVYIHIMYYNRYLDLCCFIVK